MKLRLRIAPRLVVRFRARPKCRSSRSSCCTPCYGFRHFSQSALPELAKALKLESYTDDEIGAAFDKADSNHTGFLEASDMQNIGNFPYQDLERIVHADGVVSGVGGIPREAFVTSVGKLAERLDYRLYPIAGSFVLVGVSIGMFGPSTPLLIKLLGMSTAQTSHMTTGFGLAKLFGNIPCGVAADKYGRKSVIVFGSACLTFGTLVVSAGVHASSYELILLGRTLNGLGAAGFITGASVATADVSTPRNRARSAAPGSIAFNFGNAIGPIVAGMMISTVGLKYTFCSAGALLGLNTCCSSVFVQETKPASVESGQGFVEAYIASMRSWSPMLESAHLRQATIYQALLWGSFGSGFMTCVPVLLGSTKLGLSASALGMCYGGIAVTNIIAAQPLAFLTDKAGKKDSMICANALMGASLIALPLCSDMYSLSLALGSWAISSRMLFDIPQAIAADHVGPEDRSNALAMVRTLGDIGLVAGGIGTSLLGYRFEIDSILVIIGSTCIGTSFGSVCRPLLSGFVKKMHTFWIGRT